MKLTLKWLRIKNFKGIRELEIACQNRTSIYAANGVGKTTLADAVNWLLFGKDTTGRKDFGIKPTHPDGHPEYGRPVPDLENEVEAGFDQDGREIKLRRVQKEKWVRKQGEAKKELDGHKIEYYWDDTPQKQSEFNSKIDGLINEEVFKLITNPLYFNSKDDFPWEKRRAALMKIAGEVTRDEIIQKLSRIDNKQQIFDLTNMLNSSKKLADWKRDFSNQKKKLQEEIDGIGPRINEVTLGMPAEVNFEELEAKQLALSSEITKLNESIENETKAFNEASRAIREKQKQVHALEMKRSDRENTIRQKYQMEEQNAGSVVKDLKMALSQKEFHLKIQRDKKEEYLKKMEELENDREKLRSTWLEVNSSIPPTLSEGECNCPTCNQKLPDENIETRRSTLLKNFTENNTKRLRSIETEADQKKTQIGEYQQKIAEQETEISDSVQKVAEIKKNLEAAEALYSKQGPTVMRSVEDIISEDPEWLSISSQIATLKQATGKEPEINTESLKERKAELEKEISTIRNELAKKDQIERCKNRIKELQDKERDLSEQKAVLERQEFAIDEYTRTEIEMVEDRVNRSFQFVKFRMFKPLINGGSEPCCDTMLNGVLWNDINTAGKIKAGLDIIKTFTEHYNRYAPIFIDNRESVTEIPFTDSQVISLYVSPKDTTFRVEYN